MSETIVYAIPIIFSVLVWIVLSCTQRRTSKSATVCHGRPGVVFPINFLNPRHRLVYTLACAAQASLWLNLLVSAWNLNAHVNQWINFIIKAILVLLLIIVAVIYTFPVVACVEAPIPVVGYVLGMLYSLVYLIVRLYAIFSTLTVGLSSSAKAVVIGSAVGQLLPEVICMCTIIIWYLYKLIKECLRIARNDRLLTTRELILEQPCSANNINYVRTLLSRSYSFLNKPVNFNYSKIHVSIPLPLMIAASVSTVIIFQLLVTAIVHFPYLFDTFANAIDSDESESETVHGISETLRSLTAICVIAPLLSTVLSLVLFGHLLYSVRKEILLIRKGKSSLISSEELKSIKWPSLKLTSSIRYSGFQIASVITGWMFYSIVFFVIGLYFVAVHFLPDIFGYLLYVLFISFLMVLIPLVLQALASKFVFLTSDSSLEKTLIITNRRLFNFFTYIVLLYNVATGIYTSTIRLLLAFLTTLLVKPRLDRVVFISPFQALDTGHSMYKSFLIAEAVLHNPIVHVFVNLLNEKHDVKKSIEVKYTPGYRVSQKARNRWFKAITLLNNRSLCRNVLTESTSSNESYGSTELMPLNGNRLL